MTKIKKLETTRKWNGEDTLLQVQSGRTKRESKAINTALMEWFTLVNTTNAPLLAIEFLDFLKSHGMRITKDE